MAPVYAPHDLQFTVKSLGTHTRPLSRRNMHNSSESYRGIFRAIRSLGRVS